MQLKLYRIYATKIIKVFSVQNMKRRKNYHKDFFVRNFSSKKNFHKDFLIETKITKYVFEYNDKTQ